MKIVKMAWVFIFSERAVKEFKEIDPAVQRRIKQKIESILSSEAPPKKHMKALTGTLKSLHSFRVGNYRILCDIKDNELTVLAIAIGHRRHIYST
jgi:mRNA interferase RelE/StbE